MNYDVFRHPGAWLPLVMSLAALCIVAGHLMLFGTAREVDEGAAAHLFQLLMVGQVPIIVSVAVRGLLRTPANALSIIVFQAIAGVIAFAPVWYFRL